jgi:hypothetical protein
MIANIWIFVVFYLACNVCYPMSNLSPHDAQQVLIYEALSRGRAFPFRV